MRTNPFGGHTNTAWYRHVTFSAEAFVSFISCLVYVGQWRSPVFFFVLHWIVCTEKWWLKMQMVHVIVCVHFRQNKRTIPGTIAHGWVRKPFHLTHNFMHATERCDFVVHILTPESRTGWHMNANEASNRPKTVYIPNDSIHPWFGMKWNVFLWLILIISKWLTSIAKTNSNSTNDVMWPSNAFFRGENWKVQL